MPTAPRLVAEWEPQAGVLLVWPHTETDWRPFLDQVEPVYVNLAAAITRYETVMVCCRDLAHRDHIESLIGDRVAAHDHIVFVTAAFNDTWIRDYGPLNIARNGSCELLKFVFNGWGKRFDAALDNQVATHLKDQNVFGDAPMTVIDDWVLEGGSIDTDGEGTVLTTASCLTASNRNVNGDRHNVERRLRHTIGAQRILWLEHGYLAGDDTDGHIDNLARFCDASTVCHVICRDEHDEHYAPLQAMAKQLHGFRRPDDGCYRLIPLPLPPPIHDADGRRLPASYANFLIINGAVVVPVFDDPADEVALEGLRPCFPGRDLIPVHAVPLLQQAGGIHCAALQVSAGIPLLGA
jgi:agmatine/peptidylarginine deiminase